MTIDELDVTLMMEPCLNKIIQLANHHGDYDKRTMKHRIALSATCLYHNALAEMLERSRHLQLNKTKKKMEYPIIRYLGNLEIQWVPDKTVWKVTITNGKKGKLRQPKEVLLIRKVMNKPQFFIEEVEEGS